MLKLNNLGVLLLLPLLSACSSWFEPREVLVPVYLNMYDQPITIDLCPEGQTPTLDENSYGNCSVLTKDDTNEIANFNLSYLESLN